MDAIPAWMGCSSCGSGGGCPYGMGPGGSGGGTPESGSHTPEYG
jgi:hypothetical protein